jgi:hypothetical protein
LTDISKTLARADTKRHSGAITTIAPWHTEKQDVRGGTVLFFAFNGVGLYPFNRPEGRGGGLGRETRCAGIQARGERGREVDAGSG